MKPFSLQQRADFYHTAYPHLQPLFLGHLASRPFLNGFWFLGGGNVSDFYGSYSTEYIKRTQLLFPDIKGKSEVLHLFSGSLPPSPDYSRVGQDPTGQYQSDYNIDAHSLSSFLPIRPSLIYADPPYSVEDSEHYKCAMVNRPRIVEECGIVLKPGGFLIWLDQALPVFKNELLNLVGGIAYIRSTGNRFRLISIFQKQANKQ